MAIEMLPDLAPDAFYSLMGVSGNRQYLALFLSGWPFYSLMGVSLDKDVITIEEDEDFLLPHGSF